MINISINEEFAPFAYEDVLEKTALAALLFQKADPDNTDLTIAVENDEQLQALNLQFLDIDAPTDVLSFPSAEIDPVSNHHYIGDIIISYPLAKRQAEQTGHDVISEVQLLVVHGVLHLLGFDHAESDEKKVMWDIQKQILVDLNVNLARWPED